LYSGINSALLGISVTNFVYYYWYEWSKAFLEKSAAAAGRANKKLTTVESMLAGAIAGSATVLLTNPIWVVNTRVTTRQQTQNRDVEAGAGSRPSRPPSTIGTLMSLLKNEGPQALFAGVVPALVLVINPILQYTLFEQMKNTVEKTRKVTPAIAFLLGALGKLFATSITYPYITVKSQMHVATASDKKEGMVQALRRVIQEEGYSGLYKGKFHNRIFRIHASTKTCVRHWPKGGPERLDRGVPVCLQGYSLRTDRQAPCQKARCGITGPRHIV
jgi:solute carrier family 25 (peroxisomal adenine nucleotide transporter), member 17